MGEQRLVVGLTGYPNVGKSSTINALFGSKKTAVAATPGKTKHFQARHVSLSVRRDEACGGWDNIMHYFHALLLPKCSHQAIPDMCSPRLMGGTSKG